jgi:hypothetical protein
MRICLPASLHPNVDPSAASARSVFRAAVHSSALARMVGLIVIERDDQRTEYKIGRPSRSPARRSTRTVVLIAKRTWVTVGSAQGGACCLASVYALRPIPKLGR